MAKIGMNENKAHVDEIHNIRSGSSVYGSVVIAWYHEQSLSTTSIMDSQ